MNGAAWLIAAARAQIAEQILHGPPLALSDLLATDMSDFFTAAPDARPFDALAVPVQAALPIVDARGAAKDDR